MTIDKNIPIYTISISSSVKSQYYRKLSNESFYNKGYTNIIHHEATLPENMPSTLNFNEKRIYGGGSSRSWRPVEIAIWYSHLSAWQRVLDSNQPGIIVEQDCILIREIKSSITAFPLFSFACSTRNHSLAAVGYYITPKAAHDMINKNVKIITPVDGYIHSFQPWYPYGVLEKLWIKNNIFARHFINSSIGTDKDPIGKKRK
jgi:GR25 family glycosyltransferase involved in LPS biosynthesis